MKKDRISIAKKLLKAILNKIKPEKYDEIINKTAIEIRKRIKRNYYCNDSDIFGVFGKDDFFKTRFHKEKGTKLISKISSALCKNFRKVIITGDRLYYYKKGKVKTEYTIIGELKNKIKKKKEYLWRTTFSKIMGHIPKSAIFLIDKDMSARTHEEGTFHINEKDIGLGVIISSRAIKLCKYHSKIKRKNLEYYKCTSLDFSKCSKKGSKCFSKKLKINMTTVQPFIDKESHLLIFTEDLHNIEKILVNIIRSYSNNFE